MSEYKIKRSKLAEATSENADLILRDPQAREAGDWASIAEVLR